MTTTSAEIPPLDSGMAQPWQGLPRTLAAVLRPEVGGLAEKIVQQIQRDIPEYARPFDLHYKDSMTRSVHSALHDFVNRIADPRTQRRDCEKTHRALGRNETLEGRSLDTLQRAYRIGARLSWRRFMTTGARAGIPHQTLLFLGEAILAHIDQLADLAVEGYTEAQHRVSRVLARRRRTLLDMLFSPSVPQHELDEAASAAKWPLPPEVVVGVLDGPIGDGDVPSFLRRNALANMDAGEPCFVLDAAEAEIGWENAFERHRVVLSSPVPPYDAVNALQWARRTLVLLRYGIIAESTVVRCSDHLGSLVLLNDEPLALELVKKQLAPLTRVDSQRRVELGRTLLAWVRFPGDNARIAARLGADESTVEEHMAQLEGLFGAKLWDHDACFELEMALRTASLLLKP